MVVGQGVGKNRVTVQCWVCVYERCEIKEKFT